MSVSAPVPPWLVVDELAAVDLEDDSWRDRKACTQADWPLFFPDPPGQSNAYNYGPAAEICARCPVGLPCLAAWLPMISRSTDASSGCYVGGCTPAERAAVRRASRERRAA